MTEIKLDMFAVELGLSVLLQFKNEERTINVLADAGSKKYKVEEKLHDAMGKSSDEKIRIDLIIGTHYDGDHLNGFVDIIENPNIDIGEAWLPPVANDAEPRLLSQEPQDESMLGLQFASENGAEILNAYLSFKARTCRDACEFREHTPDHDISPERVRISEFENSDVMLENDGTGEGWGSYFEDHLEDAYRSVGVASKGHADHEVRSPFDIKNSSPVELRNYLRNDGSLNVPWTRLETWRLPRSADGNQLLFHIRASAARDAINAKALAKVVNALKRRKINTRYATVDDGRPRRFEWDAKNRRFTSTLGSTTTEPAFVLLGPSKGLVKSHWDRLPVGSYAYAYMLKAIPVEEITASNELSYIGVFEHSGQRILISGDAGCVDFRNSKDSKFSADLISQLGNLQIVQVAHHAGHNAHFYHALLESQFKQQSEVSYLLLSHGTLDKYRPSSVFGRFIDELKKDVDQVQLVFTSTPREAKVRDMKHLIAPLVGTKKAVKNDDVRLEYDGKQWTLIKHSIAVD